jgi:hypothetical protein
MARREYKVESVYRYPDFAAFQAAEPAAALMAANALRRLIEEAGRQEESCTLSEE